MSILSELQDTGETEGGQRARERDVDALVREVVATLEEDIVFGYLHPRERLIEDDLRSRFGLKRHVVRQVLQDLEKMGLVERKKNIGALVKSYTIEQVVDLYTTREILEVNCVRQIAMPVAPEKIDELVALQQWHDTAVAESNLRIAFRANIAFHKAFFALSNSPTLTEMIDLGAQRAHAIRSQSMTIPGFLEGARQDHWKMIEALRQGDRERLAILSSEHLIASRDAYIQQQNRRTGGLEQTTRAP